MVNKKKALSGNAAVAEAVRQANPDVIMAYPITPAAALVEEIAEIAAAGHIDAEFVQTESVVSAMGGCIGAAAAGGRVFTATASQGLTSTQELLMIASSLNLPIVNAVVNRTLAAPANIHCDHSDSMAVRDSGWLQFYSESPQEAYDNIIQAFKIAEHPDVRTPVMACMDGFVTSHSIENIILQETDEIRDFIGKFHPQYSLLDSQNPITVGSMAMQEYYFEHKIHQYQGIENARTVIKQVGKEFGDRFGRYYGHFETYKIQDAETLIVVAGSAAGTAKEAVDRLRGKGEKVGVLKIRVLKPFPFREIREKLSQAFHIAVLDRSMSPGSLGGPIFSELRSTLYDIAEPPRLFPFVYGIGGRALSIEQIEEIVQQVKERSKRAESVMVVSAEGNEAAAETVPVKDVDGGFPHISYTNLREPHT